MSAHPTRLVDWLQLIRAEFEEPFGLQVTADEALERWPLDRGRLLGLLDALVQVGYLRRSPDGVFFRRPAVEYVDDAMSVSAVPRAAHDGRTRN